MLKNIRILFLLGPLHLLSVGEVNATPWIGTNQSSLHDDLKTLVDYGYLNSTTMTYPLPWQGIANQLRDLRVKPGQKVAERAAFRLRQALKSRHKINSQVSIRAASEKPRFTTFNNNQIKKGVFNFKTKFETNNWAGQLSVNAESDGKENFDDSYIAYRLGQWQFTASAIDQWWGPAESTSFILTNNSNPVPMLGISTSRPVVDEDSWLSFLGPWYFSAQLGKLESERHVPNTKLWRTRLNFKPFENFEFGMSWAAMWGGDGYGNSFSDFIDVITFRPFCADGSDTCDVELDTKHGNHLAGIDIKYTFEMFGAPSSFYVQTIGEDAKDFYMITDRVYLFGLTSYFWESKFYMETGDTSVSCGSATTTDKNCFYEHGDYQTGYRYNGRSMGSTFDSDARVTSIGMKKHFDEGEELNLQFDFANLNRDGQRPSPAVNGNSEELLRLSGSYLMYFDQWSLKAGAVLESSEVDQNESNTDGYVFVDLTYRF